MVAATQQANIAAKFDSVHVKIATWQKFIDEEPITFEEIKNDHGELKGAIHSLYQEALYARVTDKLSYDIIGLVALIDRVKWAADRYIRNENRIENTKVLSTEHNSNAVTNDINERVYELGLVPCDNNSRIIASGFEPLTDLVTQDGFGNLTAKLQVQGGVLV